MSRKCKTSGRVNWTNEQFTSFVDICVKGTNIGQRSGGGWGDRGWIWVENEMKLVGLVFIREQLKHKWDWMKEQWKIWKELKGKSTGLGWNPFTGTVMASNEWWDEKIQENPSFAKFREKRIGKELYEKYEIIFLSTVATGDYAYAPSSEILPSDIEELSHDDVLSTQQSGYLENNFNEHLNEMSGGGLGKEQSFTELLFGTTNLENFGSNTSQGSGKKQKRTDSPADGRMNKKGGKEKKLSGTEQVTNIVRELNEGMQESMKNKTTALCRVLGDRPGCSIEEVMKDVLSLPQMQEASDIHFFSTLLLDQKSKREMYCTLKDTGTKWKWLEYHHTLWVKGMWKPNN
ncbi:L10-interacting MYB domain-containing protein-like [Mercurialis annua]|uniref:L10-interacting MYB domain-containing protein-like n=1 Tax=Mercurialis annua TaxID=3986 RepID=UPI00216008CC|nr:L10-interacting MYB domain-containing protein-like [Mercurialis annua]